MPRLDFESPMYASCTADMTGVNQFLLVEMGSFELFTQSDLEPRSS
jgi:hypothetical protein